MNGLTQRLAQLSAAEDFLEFFGIPYDQAVLDVNRLHILKRFYQYLRQTPESATLDESALATRYRELLSRSYDDFVRSTPAEEKVFKIFQDAVGRTVSVESVRRAERPGLPPE